MTVCAKRIYANKAEAEAACATAKSDFRRTGKSGQSWKRLQAYKCRSCPYWHIGRANKLPAGYRKPAPEPKLPSFGEIRRKLERMQHEWTRRDDYERRQRVEAINKLIEAERSFDEATAEYVKAQHAALAFFFPELKPR